MRYWIGVGAALGLGGVVGFVGGWIALEDRLQTKYNDSLELMQNAYERAIADHDGHEEASDEGVILEAGGEVVTKHTELPFVPPETNPYWEAVATGGTAQDLFVDGTVSPGGISYIEEEEYQEEDGRFKHQMTVMMDDPDNAVFTLDGEVIDNWDDHVGVSIMVDLVGLVPPGLQQVLYVRNHNTDEDYEVLRVSP